MIARIFSLVLAVMVAGPAAWAQAAASLSEEALAGLIQPPFSLGTPVNDKGVWTILNSGGAEAGYVFETAPLAPLPGFSGAPINVLVTLDLDGSIVSAQLIGHNEPIFVSGLGEAPFRAFFEQYRGLSISAPMVVGTPYGQSEGASALVYLDGVTKATASVRIAHESILAATRAVAREKMQGIGAAAAPAEPDPAHAEDLTWDDLVAQGLATRKIVTNAEIDAAFAGTLWADDDPEAAAEPDAPYLDLWVVDIGPPSIARAVLGPGTLADLAVLQSVATHDEPILLIEAGRHGLVSEDFVRNTSPDLLSASQDELPIALRDADLLVDLAPGVPQGVAMILRTDRRLGFDPTRPWRLDVLTAREHGSFQPETGTVTLSAEHVTDERFFLRPAEVRAVPPWREALRGRQADVALLGGFLAVLFGALAFGMNRLAALRAFTPLRLAVLAVMTGFVGWWGQGQLSVVTPLATLRAALDGGSLAFLLYDPFSLLLWAVVLGSFLLWGRGFFCGWLCPFGALQEFAHHAGTRLGLRQLRVSAVWDGRLKMVKYVLLAALLGVTLFAPAHLDAAAEVEPFKTAITMQFRREWAYAAYALAWIGLGLVFFKGFCRYVCPLGAVMAIGGLLRGRDWIARREACGTPCQLCKVRCKYQAIRPSGRIDYSECFQCLDCVTIHDDPRQCVPLILANRPARAIRLAGRAA